MIRRASRCMRLTWKRQANEQGLARVSQGERGYDLRLASKAIAHVRAIRSIDRRTMGYYWSCPETELSPWRNTVAERNTFATIEEAKSDCKMWFQERARSCATKH